MDTDRPVSAACLFSAAHTGWSTATDAVGDIVVDDDNDANGRYPGSLWYSDCGCDSDDSDCTDADGAYEVSDRACGDTDRDVLKATAAGGDRATAEPAKALV